MSINKEDNSGSEIKEYTISILTEDKAGLLNSITIIFNRRKLNIDSLNVSNTEIEGVSRFTIVVQSSRERLEKVVKQLRRLVEVFWAFLYEEEDVYYQEIALYKVPTKVFLNGTHIESLVRKHSARILVIEEDHIIIEKTGHKTETQELFDTLEPFGVLEFVRSGRVAISRSKRKTEVLLEQLDEKSKNQLTV